MTQAGVPVIPGSTAPVYQVKDGLEAAEKIGYPVMIKAALGGGGKGMRVSNSPEEFRALFPYRSKGSADGVRERNDVSGTFCAASETYSISDPCGYVWKCDPPWRAGLFRSTKSSEIDRRIALYGNFAETSQSDGESGGESGKSSRLHQCRNGGIFAGEKRKILLYGNEYTYTS